MIFGGNAKKSQQSQVQFPKQKATIGLMISAATVQTLGLALHLLQSMTSRSAAFPSNRCCTLTWHVQVIIMDADDEDTPYRQDKRWRFALSVATWPEVFRRYVLTRLFSQDIPLVSASVARAAEVLGGTPLVRLPPYNKARLLALACDEAADTARLRSELRDRMERIEQACTIRLPAAVNCYRPFGVVCIACKLVLALLK
jgi:hypothetical protein